MTALVLGAITFLPRPLPNCETILSYPNCPTYAELSAEARFRSEPRL
jgi:hypothetical protein